MNATALHLEQFLREADPATARTVEQIVTLLMQRPKAGASPGSTAPRSRYRLPSRALGARAGLDLTKLAHVDEDL